MTAYAPNFTNVFLERYCRDKLACVLPCKRVAALPLTDAPSYYPNVNKALSRVYHNKKVRHFNEAYSDLATYLAEYPKVVNKINAVLWNWIRRTAPRRPNFRCKPVEHCKCKHPALDVDPASYLPINVINGITNPGLKGRGWCSKCKCPRKCDNGKPYRHRTCGPCGQEKSSHHDSSDSSSDSSSSASSHHEEKSHSDHSEGCDEHKEHHAECNKCCQQYKYKYHKKKCYGGCTYRKDRCYCGEEDLVCEPRCGCDARICVPKPKPTCGPVPCSNSLRRDLCDTVPSCLKCDDKLKWLIADVVRFFV